MFDKGNLLIKLSLERIVELVDRGIGERHPYSKDRITIPVALKKDWIDYAMESYTSVKEQA